MTSISFPGEERKTFEHWEKIGAFRRQLELTKDSKKRFVSYDGPPFATGLPHYGHMLISTIKDVIPRYWSMKGFYCERRFGWDTHGVPIEHEIDKKLNIKGREDVMKMGIAAYNAECRAIVMRCAKDWESTMGRLGRWTDFENDYKTMDFTFMESEWNIFQKLFQKGAVYRGYRVMPYSTGIMTPLSNMESQLNYKDVQDPALVISFPLLDDPETSLLAWTTTPWTLPSHLALCVHPNHEYIKIKDEVSGKNYILLEGLLKTLYKDPKKAKFKKLDKYSGKQMKDWKYDPPFKYFYEEFKDTAFRVLNDTYVTTESGVGIVHQAPAFGEDDYRVTMAAGIISANRLPPNPVDDAGHFTSEIIDFAGLYVKDADKGIIKYLRDNGRLVVASTIQHSYPFCWRSETPLIYRAVSSWFITVPEIIPKMLENVNNSHWVPNSIKEKRFGMWIANARDWNVSRNRYWGTPLPIWANEDYSELICIGSAQELQELSGHPEPLKDLHRETIDDITIPGKNGQILRRTSEVFDCWFESGSMPYAQLHYPFENKEKFDETFPANFICEGIDQTRGWFYTLSVLGSHLFGKIPFQNCICTGIVLAEDGKKMSKSLKNYPDPVEVLDKFGADAVRMYLISSPVVRGESLRFKESGVKEVVAKVLLPFWNSFNFFDQQVALLKKLRSKSFIWDPTLEKSNTNQMDRWILASCQSLLKFVNREMEAYRLYTVVPRLLSLIDNTTNWYIRLNRPRLKGSELGVDDTIHALNTLFEVLFILCRGLAPFAPFLTETIYQRLRPYIPKELEGKDPRSVHFLAYPEVREELFDEVIERRVGRMQAIIDLGRVSRERRSLGIKTPLKQLIVIHRDPEYLEDMRVLETELCAELNVLELVLTSDEDKYNVHYSVTADWPVLGKKLKKDMGRVKKGLSSVTSNQARDYISTGEISIDGIPLGPGDLVVRRAIKADEASRDQEFNTDNDVVIILDAKAYPDLVDQGLAREIINRVQRLRKKANLVPTDDVGMEYKVLTDPGHTGIEKVFETQSQLIKKALRRPMDQHVATEVEGKIPEKEESVIIQEEQEVQKATFLLRLVKLE